MLNIRLYSLRYLSVLLWIYRAVNYISIDVWSLGCLCFITLWKQTHVCVLGIHIYTYSYVDCIKLIILCIALIFSAMHYWQWRKYSDLKFRMHYKIYTQKTNRWKKIFAFSLLFVVIKQALLKLFCLSKHKIILSFLCLRHQGYIHELFLLSNG